MGWGQRGKGCGTPPAGAAAAAAAPEAPLGELEPELGAAAGSRGRVEELPRRGAYVLRRGGFGAGSAGPRAPFPTLRVTQAGAGARTPGYEAARGSESRGKLSTRQGTRLPQHWGKSEVCGDSQHGLLDCEMWPRCHGCDHNLPSVCLAEPRGPTASKGGTKQLGAVLRRKEQLGKAPNCCRRTPQAQQGRAKSHPGVPGAGRGPARCCLGLGLTLGREK